MAGQTNERVSLILDRIDRYWYRPYPVPTTTEGRLEEAERALLEANMLIAAAAFDQGGELRVSPSARLMLPRDCALSVSRDPDTGETVIRVRP